MVYTCVEPNISQEQIIEKTAVTPLFPAVSVLSTAKSYYSSAFVIVVDGVLANSSVSRPRHLPAELDYSEQIRQTIVMRLRGKYSQVQTSGEEFALRKQQELQREELL
jgi:hypothetical protein